mgnify:CR=1 FL=1
MVKSFRRVITDVNSLKKEAIKKLKMYDPILVYKRFDSDYGWKVVQFAYFTEDKERNTFRIYVFDGNCNPTCMDMNSASTTVCHNIDTVMAINDIYLDGFREANADVNEVIEKKEEEA